MANSPFKNVPQPETPAAPTPPTPEAPAAPPVENVAPTPAAPEPVNVKSQEDKKVRSAPITRDDIDFVRNNIKTMTYQEIADARNISKSQVNRVLQFIREGVRKTAIKIAESRGETAYGTKTINTKKDGPKPVNDYDKPLTAEARKVEEYIQEHYSRPESAGAGGGGQVKEALDDTLEDILGDLDFS